MDEGAGLIGGAEVIGPARGMGQEKKENPPVYRLLFPHAPCHLPLF